MSHSFSMRMPRFLGAAGAAGAALALAAGALMSASMASPAMAASRPASGHQASGHLGAGFRSVPAEHVSRMLRPGASVRGGTANTILTSGNWSGYVAENGTYTSVTATWTQPAVSCTSSGIAATWVGLDGFGNSTVEQTGTSATCQSGSPQYYAWYEFFPNPPVTYNEPLYPGDTMVASVTYLGSDEYSLKLTDLTHEWSENTPLTASASNATAEIITEAASVNGQTSALPDFTAAQFSNTAINGESLASAGAQQLFMTNSNSCGNNNCVIAWPSTYNGSGTFTDYYAGGLGSLAAGALTGSNGDLLTYSSVGLGGSTQAIASGTSPAIAELSNGTYETAYQSPSGYLTVTGSGVTTNTGLVMKPGTSPAIAASRYGGYEVAFQASSGSLWTYTPTGGGVNQSQGMLAGTSPAITALSTGAYEMAFQANTGVLIVYGSLDANSGLGMRSGTSPAIAPIAGGFIAAMQANTGVLWTYGTNGTQDLGLGMAAGTSPAVAGLSTGGYELAMQTNTGALLVYGAVDSNTGIGMAPGTSPAIAGVSGGGFETGFAANDGYFTLWGNAGNVDTDQPMTASPSIAG